MNTNALTNLSKTKQQIRMYQDMLKEMDGIGSYCFGEIRLLGGSGSHSSDKMLNLMARRDSVRMKIESAYSQYLEQMERAKHMLDSIEDETIRTIFYYRYSKDCSWAEVAKRVGGKATADSVKKAHERYLKANPTTDKETA